MKGKSMWPRFTLPLIAVLLLAGAVNAGVVVFVDQAGTLTMVQNPAVSDPVSALNALAAGPSAVWGAGGLVSAIPAGTRVQNLRVGEDSIDVDFSPEILANLDEAALETIFKQVNWTLRQFGLDKDVKITANGQPLSNYLPPAPSIEPRAAPEGDVSITGSLTGRSITLSPGHGIFWNGTGWYTARPVYCAPLDEEDFHNLTNAIYLEKYLANDGMLVKMVRCTDKNYGTYPLSNQPWWKMAASYWLQNIGYPCTVYASYTGDCTLGTGASESSDDIRARPLASDYDNTNIYISLHTNGLSGYCTGPTCPTGTDTYYDCIAEHAAWCTVSTNLANAVHPAFINAIRNNVGDTDWVDRGRHDSNGAYGEIRIPDRAAILIELGFHDTCDNDAVHLRDSFWISGGMWGIYKGVCDYFGVTPTWGFYSDEFVSDDIPATMAPSESRVVHITFRNKGVVWSEARAFRLGAVGDSDPFSSQTRYTISGEVGPNDTYTFTLNFTAPAVEGNYITDWQMVRDGVTWFGAIDQKTIQVGGAPDTEPPTIPQNLVATPISHTRIDLTWSPSTDNVGVAGYKVFRDNVQIGTSGTISYSDTTCSSNTTYTYEVSAYDGALNESGRSAPAVATTPPQTEFIIDNPAATFTGTWSTGTSSVDKYGSDYRYIGTQSSETGTATWTPNIEVAGNYDVFCWYPQGTNRTTAAPYTVYWNGGSQTVNMNQQANGGRWNALVSSKPFLTGTAGYVKLGNATGEASLVVMADAIRFLKVAGGDTEPPTVPTNLVATPISSTRIDLTWTASTDNVGVTGYKIFRDGGLIGTSPTNSYSDTTCSPSTTYIYRVSAYDAAGNESAQSAPAQATTPGDTTPPVISNIVGTGLVGGFRITWTTDEAATSQVEYGLTTSYGNLTPLDPALVTSHSVTKTGLARKTTYHYRVRSKDAAGNEAISGDKTVKTK
jgi:N-acetylmuramoyl-L-alanine amidase